MLKCPFSGLKSYTYHELILHDSWLCSLDFRIPDFTLSHPSQSSNMSYICTRVIFSTYFFSVKFRFPKTSFQFSLFLSVKVGTVLANTILLKMFSFISIEKSVFFFIWGSFLHILSTNLLLVYMLQISYSTT